MNRVIKKFLPRKILPRLLLIFLLPLIFTQCLLVFFFYDRHWEKIITRFSNIASKQKNLNIFEFDTNGEEKAKEIAVKLNIEFSLINQMPEKVENTFLKKKIENNIKNRLGNNFFLIFEKDFINVFRDLKENKMIIKFPKSSEKSLKTICPFAVAKIGVPSIFTTSIPKCFVSGLYFLLIKPSVGLTDGKLFVTVNLMFSSFKLLIFSVPIIESI